MERIKQDKRIAELNLEQAERDKEDLKDRQQLAVRDLQEKLNKAIKDVSYVYRNLEKFQ